MPIIPKSQTARTGLPIAAIAGIFSVVLLAQTGSSAELSATRAQPPTATTAAAPTTPTIAARRDLHRLTQAADARAAVIERWGDARCELDITVTDITTGQPVVGAEFDTIWYTGQVVGGVREHYLRPGEIRRATGQATVLVGCFDYVDVNLTDLPADYEPTGVSYRVEFEEQRSVKPIEFRVKRNAPHVGGWVSAEVLDISNNRYDPYQGANLTIDWGVLRRYDESTRRYQTVPNVAPVVTGADGKTRPLWDVTQGIITVTLQKPVGYEIVGVRSATFDYNALPNTTGRVAGQREQPVFMVRRASLATDTPGTDTPDAETPATDTPDTDTPAANTGNADTPATESPDTAAPEADTGNTDTPATDTPDTDAREADTPGTDTPDAPEPDTPATDQPTAEDVPTDPRQPACRVDTTCTLGEAGRD